jgi:predicted nucleic acid-binding protein
VRVYAESNFVLEVIREQEQHAACEELMRLAASKSIELVLPAYSLLEPHDTLVRYEREGKLLGEKLRASATQLKRTASIGDDALLLRDAENLLIRATQQASNRFVDVRTRLLDTARLVAIDEPVLREASKLCAEHELVLPDALMLASVLADAAERPSPSIFLNRNTKDFDDPDIRARLAQVDCTLIGSFHGGLDRVRYLLAKATADRA